MMAALLLSLPSAARAIDYSFSSLDFPAGGHASTVDNATPRINDRGQIVGGYVDVQGEKTHGFLFDNGSFTTIDLPGTDGLGTIVSGINNRGQIIGQSFGGAFWRTFLYCRGEFTTIDPFPGATRWINDKGQIVGDRQLEGLGGFIYDGGEVTTIDLSSDEGTVRAINDRGQIVGGTPQGFVYDDGEFTPIRFPDARFTLATGINDRGQIVGWYEKDGPARGFLYERGNFSTIEFPGAGGTYPTGINNGGQIVGAYFFGNDWRFFVANPLDGLRNSRDLGLSSSTAGYGSGGLEPNGQFRLALIGSIPNPSRDLSVSFTLPNAMPARLVVYDVSGREVGRLDVGALGAGRHVVALRAVVLRTPRGHLLRPIDDRGILGHLQGCDSPIGAARFEVAPRAAPLRASRGLRAGQYSRFATASSGGVNYS
jgi:probable HAF family extracellular repeat protein